MTFLLRDLLPGFLAVISIAAVMLTIYDKLAAKRHKRRISEKFLMIIAAVGGSAAMLFTMLAIRHKTRHVKFMAGVPLIMTVQSVLLFLLYSRFA